jgi:signal transduction histidine kinase
VIFVIVLGALLVALAAALNIGWILLNLREVALLVLGIIFFVAIIAGLVLNTVFLVREIRRNEQHDAFINAVTHELKTPLASIRLYLETLQTREVDRTRQQEFYGLMLEDSDRLLSTVEQVLRAGSVGQKRRQINETVLDLGLVARECVALAQSRHHLAAEALRLSDELPDTRRPLVSGDADELRAALSNLLDNAVKYSPERVEIAVEVAEIDERRVAVCVRDRGIGIPASQLKRIFRRFYRVPGRVVARVKGTGLGLFIVHSVVSKHGGRVFAESAGEGLGSAFTIQLPRAKAMR